MKLFVLLFLVGFAAASVHEAFDDAEEEFFLQEAEDDKTEIGKRLRETFDEILEKMKESLDKGKMFKDDLKTKLDEIRQKLKDLKIDVGEKGRELLKKVRERITNFVKDLLNKLKGDEKRSVDEQLASFDIRDLFRKLKKALLDKIDKEALKAKIEELFGKGSEIADSLLETLKDKSEKHKNKLLDFIDRFLGKDDEKRSIAEMWEKVKDYFKDLHIDIKEKFMKFGEWVKDHFKNIADKGKSKIENIRNIAKEFLEHTKGISKEVAVEALEFLKPYKEDLGSLWDQLKETVKDIVSKKD